MNRKSERDLSLTDYLQQYAPGRNASLSQRIAWAGHLQRYEWAMSISKDRQICGPVLDVGCGLGLGSEKLTSWAKQVVGIDYNQEVVKHAHEQYSIANDYLSFCVADATCLPFSTGTFEAVCSFELIEHLPNQAVSSCLSEIRRLLTPRGIFFISTPNRAYREMAGIEKFPFHEREYTARELEEALRPYFSEVRLFGQRYLRKSLQAMEQRLGHPLLIRLKRRIPQSVKQMISSLLDWDRDIMSNWIISEDSLEIVWWLLAVCTTSAQTSTSQKTYKGRVGNEFC